MPLSLQWVCTFIRQTRVFWTHPSAIQRMHAISRTLGPRRNSENFKNLIETGFRPFVIPKFHVTNVFWHLNKLASHWFTITMQMCNSIHQIYQMQWVITIIRMQKSSIIYYNIKYVSFYIKILIIARVWEIIITFV